MLAAIAGPHRPRTICSVSTSLTSRLTISCGASAAIIWRKISSTCVTRSGHVSGSLGQLSQVESCGCHSAGIRKPSAAGVFGIGSAVEGATIEGFGAEGFESKGSCDAEATDQHPEDFHEECRKIEVEEQGNDYQTGADRVQQ